jgi:hypothetical protein
MPNFPAVKTLVVPKNDCEHLLGQFLDDSHYDILIDSDTDVYSKDPLDPPGFEIIGEDNVILKFRKAYFTEDEQSGAYEGLIGAAKLSNNRGMAAGPVGERLRHLVPVNGTQLAILAFLSDLPDGDMYKVTSDDIKRLRLTANLDQGTRTLVWLGDSVEEHKFNFDNWLDQILIEDKLTNNDIKKRAQWVWDNLISDTNYANPVHSGIAGYFGRYPRRPWGGPTAYTEQNFDKFKLAWPFLQTLSKGFRGYLPNRWKKQSYCSNKLDPAFVIPKTPFTTITVNKNFRTAAHRDAGDLKSGFSNLTVVANNKNYAGGYLIVPEIRAAVNIRPGDLLLVNNHEYIHGNTPISGDENFERISLVCYFRENMLELGSAEYENLRHEFVEKRRTDPKHPDWHEGFNGVSPNMWTSEEWKTYMMKNEKQQLLDKYHPEFANPSTLEDLFG